MNADTVRSYTRRGQASGQHQALRRNDDDKYVKQRLNGVGLDDLGELFEDEHRDRHSSGAPRPEDAR